ncbi:hypothetical protein HK096_010177 [Nowakowskiella sp. JEL0078]|nr:hypothetical protein HK096_010177 [Nowakowskiella sp. JEL0078]
MEDQSLRTKRISTASYRASFYASKYYDEKFDHNGGPVPTIHSQSHELSTIERNPSKDPLPTETPAITLPVGKQRYAYFLIIITAVQVGALIFSLAFNFKLTGAFIQTNPFNFMIGPSAQTLILMGSRYVPCMRQNITIGGVNIPSGTSLLECPDGVNSTLQAGLCDLNDICGLGGFQNRAVPDQTGRFFIPIFLHGGLVHLVFNLMFQVRAGFDMEKYIGWWRIATIYFISGFAGFLFGASFSAAVSSVGASGALFGLIAALLLDLIYNWSIVEKPIYELIKMLFVILLTFFIGTLPSIDNFAHVGGFLAGILVSFLVLPGGNMGSTKKGRLIQLALRQGNMNTKSVDQKPLPPTKDSSKSITSDVPSESPNWWTGQQPDIYEQRLYTNIDLVSPSPAPNEEMEMERGSTFFVPKQSNEYKDQENFAVKSLKRQNTFFTLKETQPSDEFGKFGENSHSTFRNSSEIDTPLILSKDAVDQDSINRSKSVKSKVYNPPAPKQRYAYFLILVTILQIGALVWSLVYNYQVTGSFIQTNPFNFMIGPSPQILIFMGSRYVPCIKQNVTVSGTTFLSGTQEFQCPTYVKSASNATYCTLNDLCGLGGFKDPTVPDQWYRFIMPIFLHGGVVHILFNLLFQARTGFDMEKEIGFIRVALIYFISGFAGFLFGASYSPAVSSVGASGALFGLIAALLLDLFFNWRIINRPFWELVKMLFVILLTFFIGTLPYIDNFSHVGGFFTGLLVSIIVLPSGHMKTFIWGKWSQIVMRVIAVPILIVIFWYSATSFYSGKNDCPTCRYINCFPPLPWCDSKFQSIGST